MAEFKSIHTGAEIDEAITAAKTAVQNSGDEDIGGVKTFAQSPVIPNPTSDTQATNKKYVDDMGDTKVDEVGGKSLLEDTEIARLITMETGAEVNREHVNNLTETVEGKTLDATQGKVLNDLVSTNVGDLETLTTIDKSSLVNATNEVKNLVDTNTQFTDVDNVVYSWRFIKSAEGHMQLEYTEVI